MHLHHLAKTYGLPPHLLARCTVAEFEFDKAVHAAGEEAERRMQRKKPPRPGGGRRAGGFLK